MPARKPIEVLPNEYPPRINLSKRGKYYKREYKMTAMGREGLTTKVTIPREIILRAAEKNNLTLKDFIATHHAVLIYDAFDGAFIRFEERLKKET